MSITATRLVEAVTLDDAKRVAKRLLEADKLIVTVVGKPANVKSGTVAASGG